MQQVDPLEPEALRHHRVCRSLQIVAGREPDEVADSGRVVHLRLTLSVVR